MDYGQTVAPVARPVQVRRVEPSRGLIAVDFAELWRYRELLYRILWRDTKARYKQTFLGPAWAILRPVISMVLMAAVFGGLAGFKSGTGIPYPLFVFAGMLIWTYFASALSGATSCILNNAGIMSKVYFPRLYAPFSAVASPLIDLALAMTVTLGLFAWFGVWPNWHVVFVPVFVLLALVAGLGVGLWFAGAAVRYRDITFTVPYLTQIGMYATPVLYPVSRLPKPYSSLIALNPMTSVVEGFRWALIGTPAPDAAVLCTSAGVGVVLLVAALYYFRRVERTIVDHM